ncbi:MAG: hypothetical protein ACFFAO_11825 [Candidatus Hermodarchaeota archaeon]
MGDPETCLDYVVNAFQEGAADKETYYEWYKEFNALDDICDLEINLITDFINADYDEIISTVDGIIYFLNPLNTEESELFEMLYSIIDAEKKNPSEIFLLLLCIMTTQELYRFPLIYY